MPTKRSLNRLLLRCTIAVIPMAISIRKNTASTGIRSVQAKPEKVSRLPPRLPGKVEELRMDSSRSNRIKAETGFKLVVRGLSYSVTAGKSKGGILAIFTACKTDPRLMRSIWIWPEPGP